VLLLQCGLGLVGGAQGDARGTGMSFLTRPKRGFVLGKFMPPHAGHVYLCDFGRAYVEELTILVCSLPDDLIPGKLRFQWMKEMFPTARVVHCEEIVPQE